MYVVFVLHAVPFSKAHLNNASSFMFAHPPLWATSICEQIPIAFPVKCSSPRILRTFDALLCDP